MTKELEERVAELQQTVADLTALGQRLRAQVFPHDADLVEAREEREHRAELERRLDEIPRDGKGKSLWEPFSSIDQGMRSFKGPRKAFFELTIPKGMRIHDYPADWDEELELLEAWGFRRMKPAYYASGSVFINTATGEELKLKPKQTPPAQEVEEEVEVDEWSLMP